MDYGYNLQIIIYTQDLSNLIEFHVKQKTTCIEKGQIQDVVEGGPTLVGPILPIQCSRVVWVKQAYKGMGSGAFLRAPEAFGVFMAKYAFS